jgi:hypothetical protein
MEISNKKLGDLAKKMNTVWWMMNDVCGDIEDAKMHDKMLEAKALVHESLKKLEEEAMMRLSKVTQ